MTNPATPPKSGGMPKWLIILLVLLLLIILGCCGGFVACRWACNKAVSVGSEKAHEVLADATQRAADATRQAAPGGGGNALPTAGPGGIPGDAGGNPPTGNGVTPGGNPPAGGGTPAPNVEYAANNLPTDIPVMSGMTSTGFSTVDRVHNSGGGTFTTKSSPADVTAYYQKQLTGSGWTLSGNTTIGGSNILQFTKGGRTTTITAVPDNGSTMVTIVFEAH